MKENLKYSKSDIFLFVINILFGAVIVVFGYTIVFQNFVYYTFSYYHLSTIPKEPRNNTINLIPSQLLELLGSFWFFGVTVGYFRDLLNLRNLQGRTNGRWSGLTGLEENYQTILNKIKSVSQSNSQFQVLLENENFSSSSCLQDNYMNSNQTFKSGSSKNSSIQSTSEEFVGTKRKFSEKETEEEKNKEEKVEEEEEKESEKEKEEEEKEEEEEEEEEFQPLLLNTNKQKDFQNQDHQLRTMNRIIRILLSKLFQNSKYVNNKILPKRDLYNHYFCFVCYVASFVICSIATLITKTGIVGLWRVWFNLTIIPHLFGLFLFVIIEYYFTISKLLIGSGIIQVNFQKTSFQKKNKNKNKNKFFKKNFGFIEILQHSKYKINKRLLLIYLIPSILYLLFSIICCSQADISILKKIFIPIMNLLNIFILLYYIILLKLSFQKSLKKKKQKKKKKSNPNQNGNHLRNKTEYIKDQDENVSNYMMSQSNNEKKKYESRHYKIKTKTQRINVFIKKNWNKIFATISLLFGLSVIILSVVQVFVLKQNSLPDWIFMFLLITMILGFSTLHVRSLPDMSRHTFIVLLIVVIFLVFLFPILSQSNGAAQANGNIQGNYPWCDFMNDTGRLDIFAVSSLAYASYQVGLDSFDEKLNISLPSDWVNWPITKNHEYPKWFSVYDPEENIHYIAIAGTQLDHWSTVLLDGYYWSAITSLQTADLIYPYLKLSSSRAISLILSILTQTVEIFYPSMNHFYNDVQDYTQKIIENVDPTNPPNIFITGHSLGGGIASIVSSSFDHDDLKKKNMLNKIKSITFNSPGIAYSRKKFSFDSDEKIILENINRNSIAVKAQYDLVGYIDKPQGMVQYIECLEKNPLHCHYLGSGLKVLWNGCGKEGIPPFLSS
ncbi:remodeling and spacing factor [Anaeramoeba flamelloides]|uniref:Remodeling and spacing factor n=1 Tax=Anaeramoeba flamelloides TaxID=1746091 RepID=A0AAV7Z3E2_9EUKA|nr:remodeling and spacing factor [Anaeramoeba flamelloides]